MMIKGILLAVAVFAGVVAAATSFTKAAAEPGNQITILYDAFGTDPAMTKDWGFSALVEIAGKRILFDTGANAEIFAANVKAKGVDLTELDFVVLSHRHSDHMAGLNYVLSVNPTVRIYAPKEGFGIYGSSLPSSFYRKDDSLLPEMRYYDGKPPEVMKFGAAWANAHFELIDQTTEIAPGITLIALISDLPGPGSSRSCLSPSILRMDWCLWSVVRIPALNGLSRRQRPSTPKSALSLAAFTSLLLPMTWS